MGKLRDYIIVFCFLIYIVGMGTFFLLMPDREKSFNENRSLAQSPSLTKESFVNGEYSKKFESFFTDQFPWRDYWLLSYLKWQQFTNQTFIYKYYIHDDNWIYSRPMIFFAAESISASVRNLRELSKYANERGIELFYFSLPERSTVLKEPFPTFIEEGQEVRSKAYFISQLPDNQFQYVNVEEEFKKDIPEWDLKNMYFQTDHHWNSHGSFKGYEIIYKALNKDSAHFKEPTFKAENYQHTCYDNEYFLGSYNRQLYNLVESKDKVCMFTPTHFEYKNYEVYFGEIKPEAKMKWNSVYGRDIGKGLPYVDYAGNFTNDYKELTIINPLKLNTGKKALFIKDSYANPLTMLLAQHFYQSTFYDMRYNNNRTLYEYLENNHFDTVVFLYNDENLFEVMFDFQHRLKQP